MFLARTSLPVLFYDLLLPLDKQGPQTIYIVSPSLSINTELNNLHFSNFPINKLPLTFFIACANMCYMC